MSLSSSGNALDAFCSPQRYARDLLTDDAWYYYSTGADGELCKSLHSCHADNIAMNENREAFQRVRFRPRVFRDVSDPQTATTILGVESSIPVYVSPTARNALGQPLVSALCGSRSDLTSGRSRCDARRGRSGHLSGCFSLRFSFSRRDYRRCRARAKDWLANIYASRQVRFSTLSLFD